MGFSPAEASGQVDFQPRSEIAFLLLDGLRRQRPGGGTDVALCALGLTRDGYPRPLTMRVVPIEDERAWRAVLVELRAEGIGPDLLLIGVDGHPALIKAIQATYPDTPLQICVAHRLLALARKVDGRWRSACLAGARRIFAAADRVTAVGLFREWHTQWLKQGEPAVRSLEGDLASCLTFHRFPPHLWSRIRTVNLVERTFREARRSALAATLTTEETPDIVETSAPDVEAEEDKTVLVVPSGSNGHVTPDLIGDITMLPDEQHGAEMSDEAGPAEASPPSVPEAEGVSETPETPPVSDYLTAEFFYPAASPKEGSPTELEVATEVASEAPSAPVETLEPAHEAGAPADAPEEEGDVWAVPYERESDTLWESSLLPDPEGFIVIEPRPVHLASDGEFDRRLAAYHRYAHHMRVAVTLTSAAGLMAGVVLAFIR